MRREQREIKQKIAKIKQKQREEDEKIKRNEALLADIRAERKKTFDAEKVSKKEYCDWIEKNPQRAGIVSYEGWIRGKR